MIMALFPLAQKIHISENTKSILEEIGGYETEFRGYLDVKVRVFFKQGSQYYFLKKSCLGACFVSLGLFSLVNPEMEGESALLMYSCCSNKSDRTTNLEKKTYQRRLPCNKA